ncbi:MAG: hypothetical protein H0W83_17905 [Planctomycetes bacterium]|nr:hypothetical protein [Planctomycetota bacterium]
MSTPGGPTESSEAMLNIVEVAPGSPPPEATVVTFYARSGTESQGRVFLGDGHGGRGAEYLRLTLDRNSLAAHPDGSPFADGDSIQITIRVMDPSKILFQMEPAGLRFSDTSPAELRISYAPADGDLDHNGRKEEVDDSLENHLAIWRQAGTGTAYIRLPSTVSRSGRTVRADLPGFSRYAIAY